MSQQQGFNFIHKIYDNTFANAYMVVPLMGKEIQPLKARPLKSTWTQTSKQLTHKFTDAAYALQQLSHPNIVSILGLVDIMGRPTLLSKYEQGVPLSLIIASCEKNCIRMRLLVQQLLK